jgi:predicted TIM-barrel fold metal-dependent hydrolase
MISRRTFFPLAAACLAGPVGSPAQEHSVPEQQPILDCHQHLWDLQKFKLPWIRPGLPLARNFQIEDYLSASRGTGISKAIYMEVDVDPAQQQAEADHLIEVCKSGHAPTIAAVVSGRPASAEFGDYVRQFKGSPYIKGIRQVLHGEATPAGYCLSDDFIGGVRLLGELNLSFDLCLRPKELADGARLSGKCPETRFILDHCGNADPKAFFKPGDPRLAGTKPDHDADAWKRGIDLAAKQKNMLCKISGVVARVPKEWSAADLAPIVNHCLDAFGPDRVLFGSDWPVCTLGAPLKDWISALREIVSTRPAADQRALLWDNAVRTYGLTISKPE